MSELLRKQITIKIKAEGVRPAEELTYDLIRDKIRLLLSESGLKMTGCEDVSESEIESIEQLVQE